MTRPRHPTSKVFLTDDELQNIVLKYFDHINGKARIEFPVLIPGLSGGCGRVGNEPKVVEAPLKIMCNEEWELPVNTILQRKEFWERVHIQYLANQSLPPKRPVFEDPALPAEQSLMQKHAWLFSIMVLFVLVTLVLCLPDIVSFMDGFDE